MRVEAALAALDDPLGDELLGLIFAAAVSQAPGLSGTPLAGHSVSAISSASCASSSARSTSRVIRASAAINRARSIRNTASIAL